MKTFVAPNDSQLFIFSVTDSPYSDRVDRKESIKKLMKELSKDVEIKRTQPSKESAVTVDSEKPKTGEKSKHSALRLFRTVRIIFSLLFNVQARIEAGRNVRLSY